MPPPTLPFTTRSPQAAPEHGYARPSMFQDIPGPAAPTSGTVPSVRVFEDSDWQDTNIQQSFDDVGRHTEAVRPQGQAHSIYEQQAGYVLDDGSSLARPYRYIDQNGATGNFEATDHSHEPRLLKRPSPPKFMTQHIERRPGPSYPGPGEPADGRFFSRDSNHPRAIGSVDQGNRRYQAEPQSHIERVRAPAQVHLPWAESLGRQQNLTQPNTMPSYPVTPLRPSANDMKHQEYKSVASPFFRKTSTAQRPPTRGTVSQSPAARGYTGVLQQQPSFRMQPAYRGPQQVGHGIARSLNGFSFIQDPHSVAGNEHLYERRPPTTATYQNTLVVPRTPRNAQGLFARPDLPRQPRALYTSESSTYTAGQPSQVAHLPSRDPSTSSLYIPQSQRAPMHDAALLSIRGARGGVVPSQAGRTYAKSPYGQSRVLFSAAGGRRSVRR